MRWEKDPIKEKEISKKEPEYFREGYNSILNQTNSLLLINKTIFF